MVIQNIWQAKTESIVHREKRLVETHPATELIEFYNADLKKSGGGDDEAIRKSQRMYSTIEHVVN